MTTTILFALLPLLLGAVSLYLASANQCWRTTSLPAYSSRMFGIILLAIGLLALLKVLQPAAAAFVFVHWLMLLFVIFPYLGALRLARRRRH